MEIIVTAIVSLVTAVISSGATYIFARKKYNEEVRTQSIDNDQKREEFHNNIEQNFQRQIASMQEQINSQAIQIANLTSTLVSLLKIVCENTTCQFRQPLKKEQVEALLKGDNYGTEANQKV